MAEAKISALPAVTVPTTAMTYETVQGGVNKKVTLAQMLSLVTGTGDVVGPSSSTDNAFVRMDGTTGKLIQDTTTAVLTDTGRAQFGDGVIGGPGVSFLSEATTGLTRLGAGVLAAAVLGLEVVRLVAPSGANPQVLYPAGTVALPSQAYAGDPDTGGYSIGANQYGIATGGVLGLAIAVQTSGASPNLSITDSTRTGGAAVAQLGVQISHTLNQTSTAGFTSLNIVRTETGVGSGAQYIINALAGASGATQVFSVTNGGSVQATQGFSTTTAAALHQATGGTALTIGSSIAATAIVGVLIGNYNPTFSSVQAFTGGAGISQIGVQLAHTLNQTSTAAFTSLDIAQTVTAAGSGAQYIINAKAGAAGSTQVFAVTSAGIALHGSGAAATPSVSFVAQPTDGFYSFGAARVDVTLGGAVKFAFGGNADPSAFCVVTSTGSIAQIASNSGLRVRGNIGAAATASFGIDNNGVAFTGGAGILQLGVSIAHTLNQTSTAAFTSLDIAQTVTAAGSGSQYLINGKAGNAGATQVFAVTSAGQVQVGVGTASIVAFGWIGEVNTGFYKSGTGTITYVSQGTQYWNLSSAFGANVDGQQIKSLVTNGSLVHSGSTTTGNAAPNVFSNGNSFTGAAAATQLGVQFSHTLNQTSTAGFTSLDLVRTETAFGSGNQYFINGKAGAAGATQMFAISNVGQVLVADGSVTVPSYSFLSDTGLGLRRSASQTLAIVSGGVDTWKWANLTMQAPNGSVLSLGFNTTFAIDVNSTTNTGGFSIKNSSVYAASTGAQVGLTEVFGINQTSTASFAAHKISLGLVAAGTGTPVFGSGGSFFADYQVNSARVFAITTQGGMASVSVSPTTLASGTTNDYAGIAGYGFARITANAANSVLSGFSATNVPDGFMVVIINISASATLTISNNGVGSASANRVLTISGSDVVLNARAVFYMIYDLTSATWRQV